MEWHYDMNYCIYTGIINALQLEWEGKPSKMRETEEVEEAEEELTIQEVEDRYVNSNSKGDFEGDYFVV